MKILPTGMQAHFDSGVTTLCHLWRVTRNDGVILCFTDHDENLVLTGTYAGTYLAASGFTSGALETKTGMAAASLELAGGISSDAITDDDILSNKYDNAYIELLLVNWTNVLQVISLLNGYLGDIKKDGIAYTAEMLSLAQKLNTNIGRSYTRTCDTAFGSTRCGINKTVHTLTGTISAIISDHKIACITSNIVAKDTDWYTRGVLKFTTGFYANCEFDIKQHDKVGSTAYFTLWNKLTTLPTVGNSFDVTTGCKQTLLVCKNKFNNVINFQGFPAIPGNAILMVTPVAGGANQSGESLVGTYE